MADSIHKNQPNTCPCCNHDASCARNVQHTALSLTGGGRKDVACDFKNARQVAFNTLLGAYGAKGGLSFVSKPGDVGRKGLKKFMDLYPEPEEKRADGAGWKYPQFETGPGPPALPGHGNRSGEFQGWPASDPILKFTPMLHKKDEENLINCLGCKV